LSDVVHLLWFEKEMPDGEEDIELLIGVYSTEEEAKAAIVRVRDKKGFSEYPEAFHVDAYKIESRPLDGRIHSRLGTRNRLRVAYPECHNTMR